MWTSSQRQTFSKLMSGSETAACPGQGMCLPMWRNIIWECWAWASSRSALHRSWGTMLRTEACLDCIHEYFKHTWRQVRPLSRSCVLLSMRIERGLKPMKMEQKNQLNQLASDSFAQDTKGLYLECAQAMPWRQASTQDVFCLGRSSESRPFVGWTTRHNMKLQYPRKVTVVASWKWCVEKHMLFFLALW